jgi:hypothetical protein
MSQDDTQLRITALQCALTLHHENIAVDGPTKSPDDLVSDSGTILEFLKGGSPE